MKRRIECLDGAEPDLLVVGGGIHGAWTALEATMRGLRTALIDRGDFGSGASANSLKIIHGGFRHLAGAQLGRLRRSARELANLSRFAPELVAPLPCMLRTRRRPGRGRPSLWAALRAYEALSAGIDRGSVEAGGLIPSREVEKLCPALSGGDHTGGIIWHDGQLLDSERFVLAVLAAAVDEGGVVVNYAEASTFVTRGDRVVEVEVGDRLKGGSVVVRPRLVYNATNLSPVSLGAWDGDGLDGAESDEPWKHATGFNVVVDREVSEVGVGLESSASGAVSLSGNRERRMFFMAPWQDRTLLGTGYVPADGKRPSAVGEEEMSALLSAFNAAAPSLDLSLDEVTHLHVGSLPAEEAREGLRLADRTGPEDRRTSVAENVVGALAPKYTTARLSAVRGVDECERRIGRSASGATTGRIGTCRLPQARAGPGPDDGITRNFVRRAVSDEMAVRLGDLLLRRTNLGAAGPPPRAVVERAAGMMADELGWDREERRSEISVLLDEYHPLVRPEPPADESGSDEPASAGSPERRGRSSP